jgi:tryptophan synthase beta chain
MAIPADTSTRPSVPELGHFGEFGGRYVSETLMPAVEELAREWPRAWADPAYRAEIDALLRDYVGRPTALTFAPNLSREIAAASGVEVDVWLKREDLNHTGAHKINNCIGQVLLAKRLGKTRIIAETGAGQHGVATATVCARLGMNCIVFMGAEDVARQALNVYRMRLMGATVVPVTSGTATLKDAINEALRDWVANVRDTHYVIGSVMGPDPYPLIVRELQRVIGEEARAQLLERAGGLPDAVVACVGGGSNAMGIFTAFVDDDGVALFGVEAAGDGVATPRHAATMARGRVGVYHGMRSRVLQDADGQLQEAHSISAGLDYPGVGPEHSHLHATGRATYLPVDDHGALEALQLVSRCEGIIPALETAHAFAALPEIAKTLAARGVTRPRILVNLSGRGDKDMHTVMAKLDPEAMRVVETARGGSRK